MVKDCRTCDIGKRCALAGTNGSCGNWRQTAYYCKKCGLRHSKGPVPMPCRNCGGQIFELRNTDGKDQTDAEKMLRKVYGAESAG